MTVEAMIVSKPTNRHRINSEAAGARGQDILVIIVVVVVLVDESVDMRSGWVGEC